MGDTRRSHTISLEAIAAALQPFRVILTDRQLTSVCDYIDLLLLWNQSVNLTSLDDPLEIVARHFGESMFSGSLLDFQSGRLADVGAGAGFPGLPLKIAFPGLNVTLLESNTKKCAFLVEVVQRLALENVAVKRGRYQDLHGAEASFDFICSRALGDYSTLLQWALHAISAKGHLLLWLGTDDSTRVARDRHWVWDAPVPIPGARRRVILIGRPRIHA
jgi:16S rRNA (guanine527-N7)-methyltransferase